MRKWHQDTSEAKYTNAMNDTENILQADRKKKAYFTEWQRMTVDFLLGIMQVGRH